MNVPNYLRLVTCDPLDYSAGELLRREHQDKIEDVRALGSVFALYFQWNYYSKCYIVDDPFRKILKVVLSYDDEEKTLTEIRLKFLDSFEFNKFKELQTLKLRLEIFRQCFEFESQILAFKGDQEINWDLIISVPKALFVYKQRRMPRVKVDEESQKLLPKAYILCGGKLLNPHPIKISEFGILSVRIEVSDKGINSIDGIQFENQVLPVKLLRETESGYILVFQLETGNQTGLLFEIYRLVAYKNIRPRSEFDNASLLKLYEDTGYFGKFATTEEASNRLNKIEQVWESLKSANHSITADYIAIDDSGNPVGASSATLAFIKNDLPVWVFHQLCAKTKPDLLQNTGKLYTWRAEYLAGRPENFEVVVWFDSRSRWLERIYVKFCMQKYKKDSCLFPVSIFRKTFKAHSVSGHFEPRSMKIGSSTRYMYSNDHVIAGINPKFLNASDILDAIVVLEKGYSEENINTLGFNLAQASGAKETRVEISLLNHEGQSTFNIDGELVTDTDRFCIFDKNGLVDFLASVEHSIAVTLEKKKSGEKNATS